MQGQHAILHGAARDHVAGWVLEREGGAGHRFKHEVQVHCVGRRHHGELGADDCPEHAVDLVRDIARHGCADSISAVDDEAVDVVHVAQRVGAAVEHVHTQHVIARCRGVKMNRDVVRQIQPAG